MFGSSYGPYRNIVTLDVTNFKGFVEVQLDDLGTKAHVMVTGRDHKKVKVTENDGILTITNLEGKDLQVDPNPSVKQVTQVQPVLKLPHGDSVPRLLVTVSYKLDVLY